MDRPATFMIAEPIDFAANQGSASTKCFNRDQPVGLPSRWHKHSINVTVCIHGIRYKTPENDAAVSCGKVLQVKGICPFSEYVKFDRRALALPEGLDQGVKSLLRLQSPDCAKNPRLSFRFRQLAKWLQINAGLNSG